MQLCYRPDTGTSELTSTVAKLESLTTVMGFLTSPVRHSETRRLATPFPSHVAMSPPRWSLGRRPFPAHVGVVRTCYLVHRYPPALPRARGRHVPVSDGNWSSHDPSPRTWASCDGTLLAGYGRRPFPAHVGVMVCTR